MSTIEGNKMTPNEHNEKYGPPGFDGPPDYVHKVSKLEAEEKEIPRYKYQDPPPRPPYEIEDKLKGFAHALLILFTIVAAGSVGALAITIFSTESNAAMGPRQIWWASLWVMMFGACVNGIVFSGMLFLLSGIEKHLRNVKGAQKK
jgi:hypothetical protein